MTDGAIVRCIAELRKALGDAAIAPRFVETVPRVGYRFIGHVEAVGSTLRAGAAGSAERRVVRALDRSVCNVHIAQSMSTKTISLKKEAYERLRAARRYPSESFSEVVLRATWAEDTITARALLDRRLKGPHLSGEALDRIEALKNAQRTPEDKWADR